ncbi:hypothetical protein GOODEAATRI_008722 [Goodea atripinnis]|uniref:Cholesterol side-chain cleavage enzyme, mitochondrial n=1 Tax=Goodea atripinnis TaxID=208336 RepID=A0ABV0PM57_9TELE
MTHPWGLEIDRVELTFGGLLKAPNEGQTAPLTTPPPVSSAPTLEGLSGSLQQLAMHFLSHSGNSQPQQSKIKHSPMFFCVVNGCSCINVTSVSSKDCLTLPNEVSIEVDAAVAAPGSVEELLSGVQMILSETLVQQVGACFQFEISTADGQQHQYYLDLSQGSGAAGSGSLCREADVTLSMSDCDLVDMFQGRLRPLAAYTSGSLKVQGDVKMAMKLEELIKQLKNMWRSPVMLPLSWMEEMVASGVRCSSSMPVIRQAYPESGSIARPFSEIPGLWKNGVVNLYNFWKLDGFRNLHRIMLQNFNTFGPIYREKIGYYESVNIIKPEDAAILFKAEGHYPKRLKVEAWTSYRDYRNRKYGVLLKNGEDWRTNRVILNKEVISLKMLENFVPLLDEVGLDFVARVHKKIKRSGQNKWTTDLSQELFKYALECKTVVILAYCFPPNCFYFMMFVPSYTAVSSVLYGERLGLMLDYIDPEAQRFIDCITLMFKTTSPMLYIPPALLRQVGAKVWRDHVEAWDGIFNQGDISPYSLHFQLQRSFYGVASCFIHLILVHQLTAASRTSTGSCVRKREHPRNTQESWPACSCWTGCPLKTSKPV